MKLEFGKKIACPACALPFYDMQKTSLVCPSCGYTFDASEMKYKKTNNAAMDEIDLDDKVVDIPGFEFNDDVVSPDNVIELEDDDVPLDDMKIRNDEA